VASCWRFIDQRLAIPAQYWLVLVASLSPARAVIAFGFFFLGVVVLVGVGFLLIVHSHRVPLYDIRVKIKDELLYPLEVISCELFDVVMASTIDVVGWILMFGGSVQFLSVVKWHNLVTLAMDDVDRTLDLWHAVDVRELVKG